MTKIRGIVVVLALVLGGTECFAADNAIVRAGEHAGFSRVVLYLPARVGWTLDGANEKRTLTLQSGAVDWDLSETFSRLTQERIKAITPLRDATGLSLDLACACDIEAFWHGASMLVVDVRGPQTGDAADAEMPAPVSTTQQDGNANEASSLGLDAAGIVTASRLAGGQQMALSLAAEGLLAARQADTPAPQAAVSQNARQTLAREVARATGLGLLQGMRAERADDPARGMAVPPGPDETAADHDESTDPASGGHMILHTSSDQPLNHRQPQTVQTAQGRHCIADESVAVSEWGTDAPFAKQIGDARRAILNADARHRPDASLSLARLYVFFGFGAEARQIITSEALDGDGGEIVGSMARIVDQPDSDVPIFAGQTDCASDVALWSSLAHRFRPQGATNSDAVLRAFSALPPHLKGLLGPRLVSGFDRLGQSETADRLRRIINRTSDRAASPEFADATTIERLEATESHTERRSLAVVVENTDLSAQALLELVDGRLAAGDVVPQDWAELLGSYALQLRGTKSGIALRHSNIAALAASGRYDSAVDALVRYGPDLDAPDLEQTTDMVAAYIARRASDINFLKILGYAEFSNGLDLSGPVGNDIARRFLKLGFPAKATEFLAGNAQASAQTERRLLRAEAALARFAPEEAIASIAGMQSPEAEEIRARAGADISTTSDAPPADTALANANPASADAIPEGQPSGADTSRSAAPADEASADSGGATRSEPGQLAQGDALLKESESVRRAITDILNSGRISGDELE